jgi:hypothetical protein
LVPSPVIADRARGLRVVTGDHDGADAHRPHLGEPLGDALLDDVLEVDDAERVRAAAARQPLRDDQRRAAGRGDPVDELAEFLRRVAAVLPDPGRDRCGRALADLARSATRTGGEVDPAHPGLRGERHEHRSWQLAGGPLANPEVVLREDHDRPAFRRLVGQRRELRGVG